MRVLRLFVAACLVCSRNPGSVSGATARVLNVCDVLRDIRAVNGKTLIVVGRSISTNEGSWLGAECSDRLSTVSFTWPNVVATSSGVNDSAPPPQLPKGFKWPEAAISKSAAGVAGGVVRRAGQKWLAVYGRLETHVPLQVAMCGGGPCGIGFGHGAEAPAQIVFAGDGVFEIRQGK